MSQLWNFSPDSELLLQRCINSAGPPEENNIWLQKFGTKNLDLIKKKDKTIVLEDSPDTYTEASLVSTEAGDDISSLEEFTDPDYDILSKLNYLQEKCLTAPRLLQKLAENLPNSTAEKLIQHVLDETELKSDFFVHFYQHFLPVYFRQNNSRICTDVLTKTYKNHFDHFKNVLIILLKDISIQNNILSDFITTKNPVELADILNSIITIELTKEEFDHNLFSLYTAYKNCENSMNIQNYMFSCLKLYSKSCVTNKNYGKLLLDFLKKEIVFKMHNVSHIKEIVEIHKSPFQRPCLGVLKELNDSA